MIPLFDKPHKQAQALVSSGAPVFLSVNPVEYHGPHLSLHNDRLITAGMMRDVHERLSARHDWPLLVAADLEMGVEPVPGPGSRPVPYATVAEHVKQACDALADLGAQRIVIMTFHGAPLHNIAIEQGIRRLGERRVTAAAPFNVLMEALLDFDPNDVAPAYAYIEDPAEREAMLASSPADFHAGFGETSLTMHYAPETVDDCYRELPPCPDFTPVPALQAAAKAAKAVGRRRLAMELEFAALGMAWMQLDPFPGYSGRPHRATPDAGAKLAGLIVDGFVDTLEAVFAGERTSPAPIMRWLTTATLGGRLNP